MITRRAFCWIGLGAVLFAAGCGGTGTSSVLPPDPELMFFNVSPDSTPISFFLDDLEVKTGQTYLQSPSPFLAVTPGDQDMSIAPSAGGDTTWGEAVFLERDKSYLIVAFGLENFGGEPLKRQRIAILQTSRTSPNNSARLIVLHAYNRSTGFATPTIDFQNPGDNPEYKQEAITFGNRAEIVVASGTYTFVARRTNTENEITPQVTQNFEGGKIYLAVVSGIEDAVGAQAPKITFFEVPTR